MKRGGDGMGDEDGIGDGGKGIASLVSAFPFGRHIPWLGKSELVDSSPVTSNEIAFREWSPCSNTEHVNKGNCIFDAALSKCCCL